ncbi:glucosaminidase domain-containing protein [Staphylococcus gallinarum]|uniref:glucosaminidase domain-containing protein n=1 Tax=Staphylococcus gallinarum TaxID=1293 RepID=UPI001E6554EB|nr:glucosaminidase domain-containing protein [Staphylococcus gallinarum]MCD8920887.1 glucosaminidase domain-containing protein [Staphylococcus gallinarum]
MALPKDRKPRASEVAAWAKSRIGKRLDVDGWYGSQCWDLPNYILKRYWGFTTPGNAIAMGWYNYPKGFKKYNNTPNFVPKPGDIVVWGTGSFNNGVGHVAIVVGPSTKTYFTSIDQNWRNSNSYSGSPASKEKHSYNGISKFVRPAYFPEKKDSDGKEENIEPKPTPEDEKKKIEKKKPKYVNKKVTKIQYTSFNEEDDTFDELTQYVAPGDSRTGKPKGIYVKESSDFRDTQEIYRQRNKYLSVNEYPHAYVDRELAWHCRHTATIVPSNPDYIVLEVCGANTENKRGYLLNQLRAVIYGIQMLNWNGLELSEKVLKVDDDIWRAMKDATGYDMIMSGKPSQEEYNKLRDKLIEYYNKREEIFKETITTTKTTTVIKVKNPKYNESSSTNNTSSSKSNSSNTTNKPKSSAPKITNSKSKYTFSQALSKQMAVNPQISNGYYWYSASRTQTSSAMNPKTIWNSSVQRYQMLNLGKYQGISISKLNKILKGKGTLSGQGKAFAEGCKKHDINEIYLIAHALLESGNGTSNYASGRYGMYNFFGVGAYDSNPDYAITYAQNQGWTSPAKAIIGGAKFVRKDFIGVGQNTLYRMRWNPKKPATHQYATDIRWCQHQATTISNLYKKVGAKGLYYVRDTYK